MAMTGQKTVAVPGTPERLGSEAIPVGSFVIIEVLAANTGNIGISDSSAGATLGGGSEFVLPTGAERIPIEVRNLDQLWIDAAVAGNGVMWIQVKG
jgi:hypothetical protein